MSVAVKRALIQAGLYRADIMQFQRNSMKANLLPSVFMGKLTHYDTNRAFRNPSLIHSFSKIAGPSLPLLVCACQPEDCF